MLSKSVVLLWRYCNFSNFQNSRCRHLGFFEIQKFYWLLGLRGSRRISMPNFVQIGQSVAKILRFFSIFQDGGGRHFGLSNSPNFIGWQWPDGPDASFHQISWKLVFPLRRCCNFSYFQDDHRGILDFWNREIFLAIRVVRFETHHHAKFCQNRSIGRKYIMIFRFFKMAAAAILDCRIHKILLAVGVWRVYMHHCTKFRQNIWTTNSEYLGVSITLQNLVMIDSVVFIMWTFQYLARLAGKCLFTPPKMGVLGNLIP